MQASAWPRFLRPLLVALVLAGVVGAYAGLGPGLDLNGEMSVEGMRALVGSHAPYGPLIYMAIVAAGILTQVPMMPIVLIGAGGVLFSGLSAFAYGWVASLVGTTATFLLVRYVARKPLERFLRGRSDRLRALDDRVARNGFLTVLALRLAGGLAPPLSLGLSLTGVRLWHYVAGTAIGVIPGIAVTVFFADSIASGRPGALSAVVILRAISVLAFGFPILMALGRPRPERSDASGGRGSRLPLAANVASVALFFPLLFLAAGPSDGVPPLLLAITGSVVAVAGGALVRRSRQELGAAWSFVPVATEESGIVATGPYRLVRHPIYLGLSMLAAGEAIAFANGPALLVALAAVIPTFLWRARAEEDLLARVFGDRYRAYRARTRMIVPALVATARRRAR